MSKSKKTFTATTPTKRFFKVATLSANVATQYANARITGMFKSKSAREKQQQQLYQEIGRQVAETLGEMKGALMKLGQIASQLKDLLPDEIANALTQLQQSSAPMPYDQVRQQLVKAFGDNPESRFASIEETPFAAASIGQVHRATLHDGTPVVVKIQYPGVKESCESDLKHLKRLLKLLAVVKIDPEVLDQLFKEIQRSLNEELDYRNEANNLRKFAKFHAEDEHIVIPTLYAELSTEHVLTLSEEAGDGIDDVDDYEQAVKDQLGDLLFRTWYRQLFELNAIHCDPHPGNFAFRPNGTLVIYDFGSVKSYAPHHIIMFKQLIDAYYSRDLSGIDRSLVQLGVRKNHAILDTDYYRRWIELLAPVIDGSELYDFSGSSVHHAMIDQARQEDISFHLKYFQPSPHVIQVDRVLVGHYWNLVNMGAQLHIKPLVRELRGT